MAKTIEPVSSWQNGEEKQATVFVLMSSYDNLSTNANFQYQLNEVTISSGYSMLNALISGGLNITGQDYLDWNAAVDANEWIYNWVAVQLKLTITGEYVPVTPPDPTPIVEETIA
jgi:hypothetical protein